MIVTGIHVIIMDVYKPYQINHHLLDILYFCEHEKTHITLHRLFLGILSYCFNITEKVHCICMYAYTIYFPLTYKCF